jgi:hypothetical protein
MRHSVRIARIFDAADHTIVDNRLSPAVPLSIHASEDGDSGFHDLAKGPYILKGVWDKPLAVSAIPSEGAALIFQYGRLIWSSDERVSGQGSRGAGCGVLKGWTGGGLRCADVGADEKGYRDAEKSVGLTDNVENVRAQSRVSGLDDE